MIATSALVWVFFFIFGWWRIFLRISQEFDLEIVIFPHTRGGGLPTSMSKSTCLKVKKSGFWIQHFCFKPNRFFNTLCCMTVAQLSQSTNCLIKKRAKRSEKFPRMVNIFNSLLMIFFAVTANRFCEGFWCVKEPLGRSVVECTRVYVSLSVLAHVISPRPFGSQGMCLKQKKGDMNVLNIFLVAKIPLFCANCFLEAVWCVTEFSPLKLLHRRHTQRPGSAGAPAAHSQEHTKTRRRASPKIFCFASIMISSPWDDTPISWEAFYILRGVFLEKVVQFLESGIRHNDVSEMWYGITFCTGSFGLYFHEKRMVISTF